MFLDVHGIPPTMSCSLTYTATEFNVFTNNNKILFGSALTMSSMTANASSQYISRRSSWSSAKKERLLLIFDFQLKLVKKINTILSVITWSVCGT